MSIFYHFERKDITVLVCETSMTADNKVLYDKSLRFYKYLVGRGWLPKDRLTIFAFAKHLDKSTQAFFVTPQKKFVIQHKDIIQDTAKSNKMIADTVKNSPTKVVQYIMLDNEKEKGKVIGLRNVTEGDTKYLGKYFHS